MSPLYEAVRVTAFSACRADIAPASNPRVPECCSRNRAAAECVSNRRSAFSKQIARRIGRIERLHRAFRLADKAWPRAERGAGRYGKTCRTEDTKERQSR